MADNDPRVFFAAERTLLAWVRTGVATIGLGFVVARFGLFLRLIAPERGAATHGFSATVGVALVLLGASCCAIAALQFARYARRLSADERPTGYSMVPSIGLTLALAAVGVVLAIYLLF
jgi:putative membrane protein